METNSQRYEDILYNQIEESFGKVVYTYTTHIIQAGRIQRINRRLKWAQIILSAISTGGFLTTVITETTALVWVGGLCSTALLVLTSYFKDMDLSEKQKKHLDTSNLLWSLREDYLSLLVDFHSIGVEDAAAKRDQLKEQTVQVYSNAPITDDKSYKTAQKMLQEKESQYFSRQELNQILPKTLRKE